MAEVQTDRQAQAEIHPPNRGPAMAFFILSTILVIFTAGVTGCGRRGISTREIDQVQLLAENGNPKALLLLGDCYSQGAGGLARNMSKAAAYWQKAADKGNADAYTRLAIQHLHGGILPFSFEESAALLTKGAKLGSSSAEVALGRLYFAGNGVPKDPALGMRHLQIAAARDWPEAWAYMAIFYRARFITNSTDADAVRCAKKAAELGSPDGQYVLAELYRDGQGVPKDAGKQLKWLKSAASLGDSGAQYELGVKYWKGNGVTQNKKTAVEWLLKAAQQGSSAGAWVLGTAYLTGQGTATNFETAVYWFHMSAQECYVRAYKDLGECYALGRGIKKDPVEAYKWFLLAAEVDPKKATVRAENLAWNENMSEAQIKEAKARKETFLRDHPEFKTYAELSKIKVDE